MRADSNYTNINKWLLPFSWLYRMGVSIRNYLFDVGVLKSRSFDIPVIAIGNLTVGGTGKTPHVEYLIRLLQDKVKVAVLSRGYKRKTQTYVLASENTPMEDIGDEPYQVKHKFPDVYVAVDKDRCHGIDTLTSEPETKDVDVILLDDAFQHRYVKPGINILLVDYHRLIIHDELLPAGRLREPLSSKARADIVIITKCPKDLKPMEFRVMTNSMNLLAYQELFFTAIRYDNMKPLYGYSGKTERTLESIQPTEQVLLLTGIASPKQMEEDLQPYCKHLTHLAFRDHHDFSEKDIESINNKFAELSAPKLIITTEKDASRLSGIDGLSEEVRQNLFVLPIKIEFLLDQEENFTNKIISHVQKNSRNSILVKTKDDNKPEDSYRSGDRPRTISFRDN